MNSARRSGWERQSLEKNFDVIVVGAGFSGLWAALDLIKDHAHYRIAVLDRLPFGASASSKNAGFSCAGSASEILADIDAMGYDASLKLVQMRLAGMERIQKHFSARNIEYKHTGGWELFPEQHQQRYEAILDRSDVLDAIREAVGKNWIQLHPTHPPKLWSRKPIQWIAHPLEGGLNPYLLMQQLEKKVRRSGVAIFRGIEVKSHVESSKYVELETDSGLFRAQRLLIATNGAIRDLVDGLDVKPARAQVLLTEPIENLPFRGVFHRDEGYYYFRNVGNRVLLGGARNEDFKGETTAEIAVTPTIQSALEQVLNDEILHGQQYTIAHRWSGLMGMPTTKFPVQKWVSDRVFVSAGLGGMGVALAPMLALEIARSFKKH